MESEEFKKIKRVYNNIKSRCYNKNHPNYKNYGGKGIKMCKEWKKDFINFYNWSIENGYKQGLEIDKDILSKKLNILPAVYSPKTCMWVTKKTNCIVKSDSIFLNFKGKEIKLSILSEETGVSSATITSRLKKGIPIEKAIYKGQLGYAKKIIYSYEYKGKKMTTKEMCETFNLKRTTLLAKSEVWLRKNNIKKIYTKNKKEVEEKIKEEKVFFIEEKVLYDLKLKMFCKNIKKSDLIRKLQITRYTLENVFNGKISKKINFETIKETVENWED